MRIRIPPKRIRERFLITYELEGCQKTVNFLTRYYGVRRMRIVLDVRRVPGKCYGLYFKNRAYFTREGLKRRIVLHELYHHIVDVKGHELPNGMEEKNANRYASEFLKCRHSAH